MLIVTPCRQCGATTIPPGVVSAEIVLRARERCDACRRTNYETRILHFCSPACLAEFARRRSAELSRAAGGLLGPPDPAPSPAPPARRPEEPGALARSVAAGLFTPGPEAAPAPTDGVNGHD